MKLIPDALAKPDKRTTAGAKLNRGGSDSFFAIWISAFYDFWSQKTKAEYRTVFTNKPLQHLSKNLNQ